MMEAITFLKEKLSGLAVQFPNVQIKYAYNRSIATHVVELTPVSEYYHNESLDSAWIPISIEFMETFLAEDICFISSDSRLAIAQPELEWNKTAQEWDTPVLNEMFQNVLQASIAVEFPTTFDRRDNPGPIVIENIQTHPSAEAGVAIAVTVRHSNEQKGKISFTLPKTPTPGNTQYAMAA